MRRRFGRRRPRAGQEEGRGGSIDAARWLKRIVDDGIIAAARLEPHAAAGVPDSLAAIGTGEAQDGTPLVVGFAPRNGGDALLGALAAACEIAGEGRVEGEVIAVAPQWSTVARRRLAMLGELPFRLLALPAPGLAEGGLGIDPEPLDDPGVLDASQVAAHLTRPADRQLFARAAAALEGLASKHGGAVRGRGRSLELVVTARRSAELRADESGVLLNALLPQRDSTRLSSDGLAEAFDRLEGSLRRRLSDRRIRDGEDGLRARALSEVATALSLRHVVAWPLGGADQEVLDLVGVDGDGRPVIAAIRQDFGLADLGAALDAAVQLRIALPALLAPANPPIQLDAPRLVLVGTTFDPSVGRVAPLLSVAHELLELTDERGQLRVRSIAAGEAASRPAPRPRLQERTQRPEARRDEGRSTRPEQPRGGDGARSSAEGTGGDGGRSSAEGFGDTNESKEASQNQTAEGADGSENRRGGRRRGGRRRGRGDSGTAETEASEATPPQAVRADSSGEPAPARFEHVSFFDLDEDRGEEGEDAPARRRRGRGRRGGRRPGANGGSPDTTAAAEDRGEGSKTDSSAPPAPPGRPGRPGGRGRRGGRGRGAVAAEPSPDEDEAGAVDDEDVVDDELLTVSDEDVPDLDDVPEPTYDEDESEESDPEVDRLALEREKRRLARLAKIAPDPAPKPAPKPRRRAAILAHADPDSIFSAILLARDIRLLEGFWVYPQEELMTFFRSVATDLRDEAPIFVVGFEPRPARDVIQAASLYRDRLSWFDHHDWPPEDRELLKQSLGEEALHLTPGTGSTLPAVLSTSSRRSRFSDKLVDLRAGRFSQHDYERWGRLWWHRVVEMVGKPGDRRADIEPLLQGRPSDLAKEAGRAETPPPPREVQFVAERDFRLVHFSGYSMVVMEVPADVEMHLAARISRERYGAPLSLVRIEGSESVVLAGDELPGRRSLDFGGLVEHLATKLHWVEALPDDDHVARIRIHGLAAAPERLDEVIGEIAMSRSIFEG